MRCFSTMALRWMFTPPGCVPGLPVTLVLGCEEGLGDCGPGGRVCCWGVGVLEICCCCCCCCWGVGVLACTGAESIIVVVKEKRKGLVIKANGDSNHEKRPIIQITTHIPDKFNPNHSFLSVVFFQKCLSCSIKRNRDKILYFFTFACKRLFSLW